MSCEEIEKCIANKRGDLKESKNAELLGRIEVFARELKKREEQIRLWRADPIETKARQLAVPVDEDFKGDIEVLAHAMQQREQSLPGRPRYSCYVISLAWNAFAQQQW